MVELTQHGYNRIKERSGATGEKALERAEKAFYLGKGIDDITNKEMRKYLKNVLNSHSADILRILGNEIFLFGTRYGTQSLITVLPLNKKLIQKTNKVKVYFEKDEDYDEYM